MTENTHVQLSCQLRKCLSQILPIQVASTLLTNQTSKYDFYFLIRYFKELLCFTFCTNLQVLIVSKFRNLHINEALQMQIEVQRRLHEQLEVHDPVYFQFKQNGLSPKADTTTAAQNLQRHHPKNSRDKDVGYKNEEWTLLYFVPIHAHCILCISHWKKNHKKMLCNKRGKKTENISTFSSFIRS